MAGRVGGGSRARLPFGSSWPRAGAAALLGGAVLALVIFQSEFRQLEARAAAGIYDVVTPTLVGSREPIIWFGLGHTGAFGLVITPDCSSALLLVPLLTVGVGLMILPKLGIGRIMTGLCSAAAILVGGNLTRIGIIALAIHIAGIRAGYQLGHLIIGSFVSIVCIAISLALLTAIVTSRRGDRPLLNLLHVLRRPVQ